MSQNIDLWLHEVGLGDIAPHIASLFAAHSIDHSALPLLTDIHLREMNIAIGPRVRLLDAIASLRAQPRRRDAIERRRLTVMFADLVGSTALSRTLDPEVMRDVIRAFHRAVDGEVERYDALVAQYLGDGALVYFGYPQAHEDDAERALRAALAIVESIAALRTPDGTALAAHIGIATGLVVVGDTFGAGAAHERSVIGETPNLAARLVERARSGEIVVGAQTRQLTRHHFEFAKLDEGFRRSGEDVPAYRLVREKPSETSFDARHDGTWLQMVGRLAERRALADAWDRATAGAGQVVLVSGEPGIGKSRLARAFEDTIAHTPHLRVSFQCSPHHTSSALYPVCRHLTRAADLRPDDEPAQRWTKLVATLRGSAEEDLVLTAKLLGLETEPFAAPLLLEPALQRQRTFQALANHLVNAARHRPVLWLIEDVQWIDPSSLELIHLCIERTAAWPVLAIITFRPEFTGLAGMTRRATSIALARLNATEIGAIVHGLSRSKSLPPLVMDEIVARTDGVPLFVEELTKTLLESGGLVEHDHAYLMPGRHEQLSVPASLHDSLMARLDRNPGNREVAQIASCIGREFNRSTLQRVADLPAHVLEIALRQLQEAELVFALDGDDDRYVFKHALLRDAAYESLLRSRRETLHARILDALEVAASTSFEILAIHAAGAGLLQRAIDFRARSAKAALSRSAFEETCSHLQEALELNARLPDDRARQEQRLDLLIALGQATIPLRGYSHPTTVALFAAAHELAEALADRQRALWVAYARWAVCYVRGEHLAAYAIATAMYEETSAGNHDGHRLSALRARGISEMILGRLALADGTFAEADHLALQVAQPPQDRRLAVAQRFAADPAIATQFHVALTHWALGRTDRARALAQNALDEARSMGHVHTLAHALTHLAIVSVVDHDAARAIACCEEAAELSDKHDMNLWRGYGDILHGFARLLIDDDRAGALLQRGLAQLARVETESMVPLHQAVCCCALARAGRFDEAAGPATIAHHSLTHASERYFQTETLLWLARYALATPDADPRAAEALLRQGLAEARRQGSIGWEVRAATGLGEVLVGREERGVIEDLILSPLRRLPEGRHDNLRREADAVLEAARR